MGKNHLTAAGPIWKLFLPFLSLERWTCQFPSIYRGEGLSTASEAEKAFREGGREGGKERRREGGREGSFIPFSFSFVLHFFPLAVGQPGLSTREENEAHLNHFCWYSASHMLRTTCSLMELHVPQNPGRAEGGCQGQAKLLLPD